MALDPNEAPEGFAAAEPSVAWSCLDCHFMWSTDGCPKVSCFPDRRKDGATVIFVAIQSATAIWPYDDMGTPVEVT